jgi:CelD/BcsL family acetyltransferase involved in cellulose biosynthesis
VAPAVEAVRVPSPLGLGPLDGTWEALAAAGGVRHTGATAAWLRAWIAVYRPPALLALEVRDAGEPIAAGLVAPSLGGRWRFAGSPVTPHRTLVCRPGHEAPAWEALRGWLRSHARTFSELDVEGVDPGTIGVAGARAESHPSYALELPPTLDALLASRSRNSRQQLGKKRRRFARAGGEVVPVAPPDLGPALRRLVDLHRRRAAARGERHEAVDDRFAALLHALAADGGLPVHAHEARLDGEVLAVGVAVDCGATTEYLQTGLDPARAELSPGVLLALGVAEAAMQRGARRLDLGPGEYRYKRDIGGTPAPHWRVILPSRSARGLLLRAARAARRPGAQASRPARVAT